MNKPKNNRFFNAPGRHKLAWLSVVFLFGFWGAAKAQLKADFSYNQPSSCLKQGEAGIRLTFTDNTTGVVNQYSWNFGDGKGGSTQKNPGWTFTAPGVYNVTLTVTNPTESDAVTKQIIIYPAPDVKFSADLNLGCSPLNVNLTDNTITPEIKDASTGKTYLDKITTWEWDFGDGTTKPTAVPNIAHPYTLSGDRQVVLTVLTESGCRIIAESPANFIKVLDKPKASFFVPTANSCTFPVTVQASNFSDPGQTYKWEVTGSASVVVTNSTDFAPYFTFLQPGTYNIQLTVTNALGCVDKSNIPYVIPPNQIINIFSAPDAACDKTIVNFINQSNPDPITQSWYINGVKQADTKDLTYTFNGAGTYTVRLDAQFGTCNTSFQKDIRIDPLPTTDFTENKVASCNVPLNVTFTNNSAGNIEKFVWDFGDGTVKTELAPFAGTTLHTYNTAGIFNVTLNAFTDKGCSLRKVKNNLISIQPPQIIKTNLPDSGCAPLTIRPKVQFNIDPVITSWKWTIKDKAGILVSSSVVQDPGNIVFNDSGKYTIELEIISSTGCNQTYNWVVKVGKVPDDFSFSVTPPSNCASSPFSFKYIGPDVSGFKWKFSTGDSVDKRDFTKLFKKIEKVEVTLTAYLNGCAKTMSPMSFNVLGVVASFSVIGDCQTPLEKVIKDGSVGLIDTWEWKFGDGETRTYTTKKDTLNHRYAKSGPYMVALKVSGGGCTFIDSILVNAANENGIDFKPSKTPVCIADSFLVLNAIADNPQMIKSYIWDGGCGYTGQITTANPKIYFTDLCKYPTNLNRGLYRMQLRIEDLNGCIYTSPARDIMAAGPIANYSTLSATSGCENLPVSFQDRSNVDGINQVISRLWDFGDGTAVTNILNGPVQHIYRKPGSYTVKLTLVDNLGCNSVVEKTTVQVSQSGVDFYPLQTASCLNKLVQFQVISPTKYVSFRWDLGDGGPLDFTASPTVKYTVVGKKDISLTVVDGFGCQSTTKKAKLVEIDMPSADIDVVKDFSDCPPFSAQFLFKGKFAESYKWSFGNGASSAESSPTYVYLKPGKYNATLKVISPGGCEANSRVIPITVEGPTGIVDYNPVVCEPYNALIKVDSRNAKSVTIDYGDGYADENLSFGTGQYLYQYKDSGTYTPNVFISNGLGCTVLLPQGDPIKAVSVLPIFRGDDLFHCDRGIVSFTDLSLSNDQLAGWSWQFGDLQMGTGKKPSHFYQSPGLYSVKMTVTTSLGCVDTLTRVQYVDIQASPDIAMDVSKPVVCEEDLIQLTGIEVRPNNSPIVSWFWDFTNGNSAGVQIPEKQLFRKAGTYPIRIYATNQKGCSDTLVQNLVVHAIPSLDAGSDSILCFGTPIQLKPQGATTYEWLSGPSLSCTNCEQPFVNPIADAIYFVKGTSVVGCSTIDSVNIKVIQPSTVVAPADTLVCFGDAIRLNARGTLLYSWTPANGLSRADIASPTVKPTQTTTYTVTGKDAYNCFVTKDDVVVTVVALPTVNAGRDTTIMAGYPLQLKPVYSPDVSRVQWVPSLFLNCSNCKTPITTPSYSATYTLFAYTPEGCMSKDVVNIFATCTGDNLFIPNTFSPNGDGINEVFYPRGRGIEKIRSMKIFSRWGQLIYLKENFLANDQNAAWDGKRQGQFVTPDVYVYMIDLVCENGNIITLKGDVTLIR